MTHALMEEEAFQEELAMELFLCKLVYLDITFLANFTKLLSFPVYNLIVTGLHMEYVMQDVDFFI